MSQTIVETKALTKYFSSKKSLFNMQPGIVKAVDGVNLSIFKGETLGLVGESGCGKSTLGRTILKLIPATDGKVLYNGSNILSYDKQKLWETRKKMQIIFQDPYGSLNPRMSVEELVSAPLNVYGIGDKAERHDKTAAILEEVGIGAHQLKRFPHEFSGGQRQRIGIARALILEPEFVVCDEPVSALDVSVRAQVLNLMRKLQIQKGLTYLFISHDLSVVKHTSDRIAVMYLGNVVELAEKTDLYKKPLHPYTQGLLNAIPIPDTDKKRPRASLLGDIPSAYNPPPGCRFHTRCPYAKDNCSEEIPALREIETGHFSACHFAENFI